MCLGDQCIGKAQFQWHCYHHFCKPVYVFIYLYINLLVSLRCMALPRVEHQVQHRGATHRPGDLWAWMASTPLNLSLRPSEEQSTHWPSYFLRIYECVCVCVCVCVAVSVCLAVCVCVCCVVVWLCLCVCLCLCLLRNESLLLAVCSQILFSRFFFLISTGTPDNVES